MLLLQKTLVLLVCALLATGIAAEVVETTLGKVQGSKGSSKFTGREYWEFKGIPYGKQPVRLENSEPADPWDGIRDGSNFGSKCVQLSFVNGEVEGEEDCLFINVFAHEIDQSNLIKPVIVLIHGGSFQFESAADYSPEYIMEQDVVLVTFNFRLGIMGFLSSGEDGVIAGNFGLKDQVLALTWVRDNVKAFGGNPQDVTLLGFSSGAAAVHLHMLSPLSKGLFHKAISMSGTGLMPWVFTRQPENRLKKIAKLLKCEGERSSAIKTCLQKVDVKSLVETSNAFQEWYIDPIVPLGPVLEKESKGSFITRFPYEIIFKGDYHGKDIPWLLGVNSHEGLLHAGDIIHHGMLIRVINVEWEKAAPITLILRHASFDTSRVVQAIKEYYFEDRDIDNTTLGPLINMYSDRYFYYGTRNAARTHLQNGATGNIFLYYFDQLGHSSVIHMSNELNKNLEGVAHYDQVQYLFRTPDFGDLREDQHDFANKFVGIVAEFARSGAVQGWVPVAESDFAEGKSPLYNVIGSKEGAIPEPFTDRIQFWENLKLYEDNLEFTAGFMESMVSKAKENELKESHENGTHGATVEIVNERVEL